MATYSSVGVALLGVVLAAVPRSARAQKAIDLENADAVRVGSDRRLPFEIVAVVPKPFLKRNRLEVRATGGVTVNDPLLRHWQLAGQLSYFLSEKLAVGVEGALYRAESLEAADLVPLQARRLPSLNRYIGEAALDFQYAPIYGKFAHARTSIAYWEGFFTSGIGAIRTQTIPRDPALAAFVNNRIAANVGFGIRLFGNRFTTFTLSVRDYIFVDKLEPRERTTARFASAKAARANADPTLINHIVVQLGVAFWLPLSFHYRHKTLD